jgi:two-component system NtrC family sensor kinase
LNALQSLPERDRGVHIRAGFDADNGELTITFRDEGRGISARDLGRLTEPFFTTRSEAGGTGLGLSISRSIMESHGGGLAFESEPGTGTTVTIQIPAIPSA